MANIFFIYTTAYVYSLVRRTYNWFSLNVSRKEIRGILAIYHFEAMFDTASVLPDSVEQFETLLFEKMPSLNKILKNWGKI